MSTDNLVSSLSVCGGDKIIAARFNLPAFNWNDLLPLNPSWSGVCGLFFLRLHTLFNLYPKKSSFVVCYELFMTILLLAAIDGFRPPILALVGCVDESDLRCNWRAAVAISATN